MVKMTNELKEVLCDLAEEKYNDSQINEIVSIYEMVSSMAKKAGLHNKLHSRVVEELKETRQNLIFNLNKLIPALEAKK